MSDLKAWRALADRMLAKGTQIFGGCDVPVTGDGPRDPRVVGLALLGRTLSAVEAASLLLDNDMVVEARTLVRTIHENLFYAAALAARGAAFVEELELDDRHSRKARAGGLIEFAKAQVERPDFLDKLEAFRADLVARPEKTFSIKFEQAARAGNVLPAFIVYRELSTDAAHPTAESLSRHILPCDDPEKAPFAVSGFPLLVPLERADTAELLCSATLGVLVAVNELVGGVNDGELLRAIGDDFLALSASNKAERDAAARVFEPS